MTISLDWTVSQDQVPWRLNNAPDEDTHTRSNSNCVARRHYTSGVYARLAAGTTVCHNRDAGKLWNMEPGKAALYGDYREWYNLHKRNYQFW